MATSGKGTGIVGYNVQIAVDAEHHLIVAHDVTNVGSDRAQLTAMSRKAREASGCEEVTVLADRGYYNGDEVLACPLGQRPLFAHSGRLESLRVSDAGPGQKRRRGLKGRRLKASEGGNRGPLRWRRRGGWGYGDLRAGRSVERGSRPAWSAWSGMFEAICEGGSREEAHATDRRKTVLAAADDGGVSGNMPPRPVGES
jgi:hypothetical protein